MLLHQQFHLDSNGEQVQDLNLAWSIAQIENGNSHVLPVEDNHVARRQLGGKSTVIAVYETKIHFQVICIQSIQVQKQKQQERRKRLC